MDAPENNISPERWNKHFCQLLNSDPFGTEPGVYKKIGSFDPILDRRGTTREMQEALAEIKIGKAPGPDGVLVEYLKVFGYTFEHILVNFINTIFSTHIYPSN